MAGIEPPTSNEGIKAVVAGIRRSIGTSVTRKAPATAETVRVIIADIPEDLRGLQALRRSLDVSDLAESTEGILVRIKRSKTDQEGAGDFVSIPHGSRLRPVAAVKEWLEAAGIKSCRSIKKGGLVTSDRLSDRSVAQIIKLRAKAAGFDSTMFSGHSLRAGFVTSALHHGADILRVMDVTRHREVSTLKTYDRRAKASKQHAGDAFL
jgi:integrase